MVVSLVAMAEVHRRRANGGSVGNAGCLDRRGGYAGRYLIRRAIQTAVAIDFANPRRNDRPLDVPVLRTYHLGFELL